jgi:membrane protease YdiL (CAAX protease family)
MNPKLRLADALIWTVVVWFAMQVGISFVVGTSGEGSDASRDLVTLAGVQVAVFLGGCALFAARRPGASWSDLFALRPVSPLLLVVALLLGVAVTMPADFLATTIQRFFPLPKALAAELSQRLEMRSPAHGVALFLVASVLGPFSEELLFRGALFTGLRPHHTPGVAIAATSILFAMTHPLLQFLLPIAVLAVVLGWLRSASGSLAPSFMMHIGYNGATLAMAFKYGQGKESEFSSTYVLIGSAATLVLLVLLRFLLANDGRAVEGRRLDREAPVIAGETLS